LQPLRPWMRYVLWFAGAYNVLLGLNMVARPEGGFEPLGLSPPDLLLFVQLVGLMVGVFGIGYLMVARWPLENRGVLLLGIIGKALVAVLGLAYVALGKVPPIYLLVVLFSDVIYLAPFAVILRHLQRVAAERAASSTAG
jgi:small multidrug resistance pump